jgi:glycosyltransferase involved in cell wall biosynthesis
VIRTGYVKDFRAHLQAADLAICPIEHGAGTKIKFLEFLAAGLPTVAFSESLHGTDARDGVHAIVAEKSVMAVSSALQRLASDGELAAAIGNQGRQLVAERYSWRHSARLMNKALLRLAPKTDDREPRIGIGRG